MRTFWKLAWFLSKLLWLVSHKLYMASSIPLMRKLGFKINGRPLYVSATVSFDGADYSLVELNQDCVISSGVRVLTHDFSISRPAIARGLLKREDSEWSIRKPVVIGRNAFVGARSILLPGTVIGENCILGAGSVARGKLDDGGIYIGNPCERIMSSDDYLDKFLASRQLMDDPEK